MRPIALEWIGTRTASYAPTVAFFRDVLGLPAGHVRSAFVRFDLPDGGSIEVFQPGGEEDHAYFTTGPVVGIQVEGFDEDRAELLSSGVELLGGVGGEAGDYRWQHFRGPDGAVYEIVDDPRRRRTTAPVGPCGVRGFGWVGIRTTHYEAMRKFAVQTLHLPIDEEEPDGVVFEFPSGDTLELFRPGGRTDHAHLTTGPMPGLIVQDLEQAERELSSHRVEILARRRSGPAGWSHFRAPDGNVYELKRSAD
jgi:catechol 2,3-dioxygenase-like lactoylglutathione lyase family enzyme